ncbi:nucleotidyltransferase family protein [Beijerinckia sp. L45]|uniref:nucleotidyltransferase family protein n=1 Tax=Beijerinckia sp. L45 TaxID=1641855 RepID=UPI00131EA2B9|nr:nucleotidyltransferase domain-containing protein [Beijerinckia sp. L45]
MDSDLAEHIIATLRDHEVALRAAGLKHLSLFGSVARGNSTGASDIDLAAVLNPEARIGFGLVGLERHLSEILGRAVDLVSEPAEKQHLQINIDRDRRVAF